MLFYVRVYYVKGKFCFSVVWINQIVCLSGIRYNVFKYGFLFEFEEVVKKNFYVQCISCYESEDVFNFIVLWNKVIV